MALCMVLQSPYKLCGVKGHGSLWSPGVYANLAGTPDSGWILAVKTTNVHDNAPSIIYNCNITLF